MPSITELIIKTSTFVSYVRNRDEHEVHEQIEHTYSIELEGDFDNPTFTMPEDIDATQQNAISLAVEDYIDNHYNAAEAESDYLESGSEDFADSIRKYGHE